MGCSLGVKTSAFDRHQLIAQICVLYCFSGTSVKGCEKGLCAFVCAPALPKCVLTKSTTPFWYRQCLFQHPTGCIHYKGQHYCLVGCKLKGQDQCTWASSVRNFVCAVVVLKRVLPRSYRFVLLSPVVFLAYVFFDNCLTIGVLDIPKLKKMCAHWRSQNECSPSSCGITFFGITSALPSVRYDQDKKLAWAPSVCCSFVRKAQECPYLGFLGERFGVHH